MCLFNPLCVYLHLTICFNPIKDRKPLFAEDEYVIKTYMGAAQHAISCSPSPLIPMMDPRSGPIDSFTSTDLPAGFTVDPLTGALEGGLPADSPVRVQYEYTLKAKNAGGIAECKYVLKVELLGPLLKQAVGADLTTILEQPNSSTPSEDALIQSISAQHIRVSASNSLKALRNDTVDFYAIRDTKNNNSYNGVVFQELLSSTTVHLLYALCCIDAAKKGKGESVRGFLDEAAKHVHSYVSALLESVVSKQSTTVHRDPLAVFGTFDPSV